MVERYLRQSPLAPLGLGGRAGAAEEEAGVTLGERPFPAIVDLRAEPSAAFQKAAEKALGFALPLEAGTSAGAEAVTALWLGPNQWWIIAADGSPLPKALDKLKAGVTEVGESRTCIHIAGRKARDLIVKGCPLDLHSRVFAAGACAQSLLGKVPITLHQVSDQPAYNLYVLRSFSEFLWLWLEDAAQEYGLAVAAD